MGDILLNFYLASALTELALFGVIAYTLHSLVPINRMSIWGLVLFIACIPLVNTLAAAGFVVFVFFMVVAFNHPFVSAVISIIEHFKVNKP